MITGPASWGRVLAMFYNASLLRNARLAAHEHPSPLSFFLSDFHSSYLSAFHFLLSFPSLCPLHPPTLLFLSVMGMKLLATQECAPKNFFFLRAQCGCETSRQTSTRSTNKIPRVDESGRQANYNGRRPLSEKSNQQQILLSV